MYKIRFIKVNDTTNKRDIIINVDRIVDIERHLFDKDLYEIRYANANSNSRIMVDTQTIEQIVSLLEVVEIKSKQNETD